MDARCGDSTEPDGRCPVDIYKRSGGGRTAANNRSALPRPAPIELVFARDARATVDGRLSSLITATLHLLRIALNTRRSLLAALLQTTTNAHDSQVGIATTTARAGLSSLGYAPSPGGAYLSDVAGQSPRRINRKHVNSIADITSIRDSRRQRPSTPAARSVFSPTVWLKRLRRSPRPTEGSMWLGYNFRVSTPPAPSTITACLRPHQRAQSS
uniref:Uncharacterized protein n=1 Tax=Plectus sambesii TaxID=2011161 RepID=A0A914ULN4_9BILA